MHAFDPQHARAIGLPVRLLHYGLLALVSLTVVAALQAVGIILAIAFLIAPGATAFLWVRRFGPMLAVAIGGRRRRVARSASTRASGSTARRRRRSCWCMAVVFAASLIVTQLAARRIETRPGSNV